MGLPKPVHYIAVAATLPRRPPGIKSIGLSMGFCDLVPILLAQKAVKQLGTSCGLPGIAIINKLGT